MALNRELFARVRLAEEKFGDANNWPQDEVDKMQALANREGNPKSYIDPSEREEVRELAERGFFVTHIGIKLHHSRGWVLKRMPEDFEYTATEEDQRLLKIYQDKSVREVGRLLHRDLSWVREMRRKYG